MKLFTPTLLVCLLTLSGCSSVSNSGSGTRGSTPQISGNWQMSLAQSPTSTKTESGFISQSGQILTGSVLLGGQTLCPGLGTARGKITGSNISLTVNQIAQTVNLTGTVTGNASLMTMSGQYSILSNGCGGTTTGTWTASRVNPVKGTYTGSFTSQLTPGLTYDASAAITQGANASQSNAELSGTLSSTTSTCYSSVNFTGVVGGTSFVLNFLDSTNAAVGQLNGTLTADATTLTGNYNFIQTSNCAGDYGTITLALPQ